VLAVYKEVGWGDASQETLCLSDAARLCIEEASYELSLHRLDSMLGSWVAILILLISLVIALVCTVLKDENENSRLDLETAYTIAVVTLLFIFIPITKLSGDIGKFTAVSTAVDAIEKLNRKLLALRERVRFPLLSLRKDPFWNSMSVIPGDTSTIPGNAMTNIELWPSMASYYGMNSL
jgi:low affinity Fe/Cu permease